MLYRCTCRAVLGIGALLCLPLAVASVVAGIHGVVHDPQHRPIGAVTVTLRAAHSDFVENATTTTDGEFSFANVPVGDYVVTADASGFASQKQTVTVVSNTSPVLPFELSLASV